MPSKRKFHKYTITVTAVSEEHLPNDLATIVREGDVGCCVLDYKTDHEDIDAPTAARLLGEMRSDSEFFSLTEDGEELTEDEGLEDAP